MKHQGAVLWFTGLSGAGKTTIANALYPLLKQSGCKVEILDGDIIRTNLSKGLGFSKDDRNTNIRRIGFVAELLARNGVIVLVAAISPYQKIRDELRNKTHNFIEVFINAPLAVCEQRDVKGLYKKARSGEIKQFTGISDPYEAPSQPEIECLTDLQTLEESVAQIQQYLIDSEILINETRETFA